MVVQQFQVEGVQTFPVDSTWGGRWLAIGARAVTPVFVVPAKNNKANQIKAQQNQHEQITEQYPSSTLAIWMDISKTDLGSGSKATYESTEMRSG